MSITLKLLSSMRESALEHMLDETGLEVDDLFGKLSRVNAHVFRALAEAAQAEGLDVVAQDQPDTEDGLPVVRLSGLGPALQGYLCVNNVGNHIAGNLRYAILEQQEIAKLTGDETGGNPLMTMLDLLGGMDDDDTDDAE